MTRYRSWLDVYRLRLAVLGLAALLSLASCGGGGGGSGGGSGSANNSANWSITAAGGVFQTTDGRATLTVPQNSVSATTVVSPQLLSTAGSNPSNYVAVDGTLVQFNAVAFSAPVTLRFAIPASVADADVPFVRIFRRPDGSNAWLALPTTVDVAARTAQAQVSHFSGLGVFTPTLQANEWAIDAAGGNFNGVSNRLGLSVPANAVNRAYRVRFTPIALLDLGDLPAGWRYIGDSAFDFVWSDTTSQFNPAATFRLRFAGINIPCDISQVALFTRTDFGAQHQWTQNATGVDTVAGEATLLLGKLRQHALFCPEQVLPAYLLTREVTRPAGGPESTSIAVRRLDANAFVTMASQTYVSDRHSATVSLAEGVVFTGSQVSSETLYVATVAFDFSTNAGEKQLVALNVANNSLEVLDTIPGPTLVDFEAAPGISPDGAVVASKIRELSATITPNRRAIRTYSRASRTLVSEVTIDVNDKSDVAAVTNTGAVALSNARDGGNRVTVIRNGSVQMQISGVMPRFNLQGTKVYVANGGQIEEHDLTTGQVRNISINPVDFAIQSGFVVHYKSVAGGCQLVRQELITGQQTVVAPLVDCPVHANNAVQGGATQHYMVP